MYDILSAILSQKTDKHKTGIQNLTKYNNIKTLWHALCSIFCRGDNAPIYSEQ